MSQTCTVIFDFQNCVEISAPCSQVQIEPTQPVGSNGNYIVTGDPVNYQTDVNDTLTVNNLLFGTYNVYHVATNPVTFQKHKTKFSISASVSGTFYASQIYGTPVSQSNGTLAYTQQQSDAIYQRIIQTGSLYQITASMALNGGSGGTTLFTGSTYPITSSWAVNSASASYLSGANAVVTNVNATNLSCSAVDIGTTGTLYGATNNSSLVLQGNSGTGGQSITFNVTPSQAEISTTAGNGIFFGNTINLQGNSITNGTFLGTASLANTASTITGWANNPGVLFPTSASSVGAKTTPVTNVYSNYVSCSVLDLGFASIQPTIGWEGTLRVAGGNVVIGNSGNGLQLDSGATLTDNNGASNSGLFTGNFTVTGSTVCSGSLTVLGAINGTASLANTASFVTSSNVHGTVSNASAAATANTASYLTGTAGNLTVNGTTFLSGSTTFVGDISGINNFSVHLQSAHLNASTWINLPSPNIYGDGAYSGIGTGGNGSSPWLVQLGANGQFAADGMANDLVMRNLAGGIRLVGNSSSFDSSIIINNSGNVGIGIGAGPDYFIDFGGTGANIDNSGNATFTSLTLSAGLNVSVDVSNASSLTMNGFTAYVFTGSSAATWSLSNVSSMSQGAYIMAKNRGAANLLITASVANQIYNTTPTSSYLLTTGSAVRFLNDTHFWDVM